MAGSHNIRQLQREVVEELEFARMLYQEQLKAQTADLEERLQACTDQLRLLENSTSFKVTRPLRALAQLTHGRSGRH